MAKDIIDIPGYSDVVIISEYIPILKKDEGGKTITKEGEVVPHRKIPSKVSFYQPNFDEFGRVVGVDLITLTADSLTRLFDKFESIRSEPEIESEYWSNDLPF